jgi:hypothetical protein
MGVTPEVVLLVLLEELLVRLVSLAELEVVRDPKNRPDPIITTMNKIKNVF